MVMLEDLADEAKAFVDGLDRGCLGSFAVSRDGLISAVTVRLALGYPKGSFADVDNRSIQWLNDDLSFVEWAECHLWMGWIADSEGTRKRYDLLTRIKDAPAGFLDFYEHGFWDDEAIGEFVASGVDAEMALRVLGED